MAPMSATGVDFLTPVSVHMPDVPSTFQTANLSGERRSPFELSAMSPSTPSYASACAEMSGFMSVALMPLDLPLSTTSPIVLPRMNRASYAAYS